MVDCPFADEVLGIINSQNQNGAPLKIKAQIMALNHQNRPISNRPTFDIVEEYVKSLDEFEHPNILQKRK